MMSSNQSQKASKSDRPKVVIVGGGFGGLYAARGLAHAPVQVTIIDRVNYHLFRPMLYQVATGLLSADEIAAPIRSILSKQKNVDVLMEEVIGVDTSKRLVRTREAEISYDYLILATGIKYNYFGHDEWKVLAPGLDSVDDADHIRGKILTAFEEAERLAAGAGSNKEPHNGVTEARPATEAESEETQEGHSEGTVKKLLTFVLVGAGTAGVEMAGTIAEMARMALARDFRHIDPRSAHIILFEAGPRILPTYPEKLAAKARAHLESLGVDIRVGVKVERVDDQGVIANGERISSRTVLWSAGVTASGAGRWIGAETDRAGRIKVGPDLSVPGHPELFAIGDTALVTAYSRNILGFKSRSAAPLPGVAQPAIQGGKYVASVIKRRVTGKSAPAPFWYWDKGNLAIVGRTFAVADLNVVKLSGLPAWAIWIGVHIFFLIGFANRLLVMLQWSISFLTKRRGVRIFPMSDRTAVRDREAKTAASAKRGQVG
ncbi:MAG TPA: NAD(P)/FAD-dependent oxidoreductase [Blastocatellia bacterium]|nr:NAD(P)/FAD-dependent oxidoreductase [Blastocatellia bacterium]